MDKNVKKNVVIIVLVIFLGFSTVLNVYHYAEYQSSSKSNNDLAKFQESFGNVQIRTKSLDFSPPVSIHETLNIVFENDSWIVTALQNMTAQVNLYYGIFYNNIAPIESEI